MIKRYDILVYNTEFGPAYEMIDGLTWCLSEDVEALETETAELRARVGELEETKQKIIKTIQTIYYHEDLPAESPLVDHVNKLKCLFSEYSSPLDVEKGEEGNGNN